VPPPTEREISPADNAAPAAAIPEFSPVVPIPEPGHDNVALPAPEPAREAEPADVPPEPQGASAPPVAQAPPAAEPSPAAADNAAVASTETAPPEKRARTEPPRATRKGKPVPAAAPRAKEAAPAPDGPPWARKGEELVYRVDFIGITMGYARFRYQGKVSLGGKVAYHLNVRAWTSGVLAYIYPINETIDYYLDAETVAPLRQEFTQREKDKDDVATYDQETGKITYRYRETGEIRKRVETVPSVYDPVSVAYYFRWRDLGGEERPRNVYGGRKLYQISARVLGNERLKTERGELDTIVVQPIIRRDGKEDNKGDLRMWLSNDERRIPVRVYAKFTKIKEWTLVGELMPAREGG